MNFNEFLFRYKDYLPNDLFKLEALRDKIEKLDKKASEDLSFKLNMLEFINPNILFWVGCVLLGMLGADRFMIKSVGLGILKLALFLLTLLFLVGFIELAQEFALKDLRDEFIACFSLSTLVFSFWIADWFLVPRKYKDQNYEKIIQLL